MGVGPITPESAETLAEDAAFASRYVSRAEQATAIVSGFTDAAVQAAITASGWPANPARIFLPAGVYAFTTGITVDGGGALSTPALHFYGHNAVFRTTTIGCTLVTLTNSVVSLTRISFHGISFNTNASNALGVLLNNAQLCSFTDCTFNGNFSTGMKFTGTSTYNMIDGCHFGDLARGVYLASGSPDFLHIRNCMFNEQLAGSPLNWIQQDVTAGAAIGIKITDNTFYGSGATLAQVKLMHVNSALIANNTFSVSPFGAIYIGAGGTSDHNSIVGNVFDKGGNADDIYLHGSNRTIINSNRFLNPDPNFSVPSNTYSNIRIRDPFGSGQGSGCVVIGNASSATATALNYVVHADATCANCVVMGNVGRADFLAAHVSNVVTNNIAA